MDKQPLLVLLILFIILGFAYGPMKKNNLNQTTNNSSSSIGNTTTYSNNKDVESGIKSISENVKNLKEDLTKAEEESRRSPFYGKVRISNISGLYQDDPDEEYAYLSTNLGKNETVKITGWILKSRVTGYYAVIGKAALLPFPFTKTESNIVLQQNDRAYITKGFSPIGISFRTNICAGYLAENRNFVPSLYTECPYPIDEKLPVFSSDPDANDECIDVMRRIPRCTTKGNSFIRDLPDTVPTSCKTYITEQINYNTCVALHYSDTNFPGNEYRVYLNRFGPLWRKSGDKIDLLDQNGLIVDTISF